MKKNIFFYLAIIVTAFMMAACGQKSDATEAGDEQDAAEASAESVSYTVDTESSVVAWEGSKVTGDSHNGTIQLSEGTLSVKGGNIEAGNFTIDMATIKDLDLEDPDYNTKLVGHLSDSSFFDVAKYPTAKLEIVSSEVSEGGDATHNITANLTMKDVTKSITFPATVKVDDSGLKANASFTINRADWNVKYGSGSFFDDLGENLINDDIKLDVTLAANSQ